MGVGAAGLVLLLAVPAFGAGGSLPDVLIQADEKRPVQREKPPLVMEVKEEAPLDEVLKTEEELYRRIPAEVAESTKFVTGIWKSPHVAVPSSNWIVLAWKGEPAYVFYPAKSLDEIYQPGSGRSRSKAAKKKRKKKKKRRKKDKRKAAPAEKADRPVEAGWDFVVVDAAGRVFRKFYGAGDPPESLEFDGRSDEGKWLKVGQVYQGVLSYRDPNGRRHTAMGRPFALAGLSLQKSNGYVISLAAQTMFSEDRRGKITGDGKKLLKEAAQLIQRHHAGLSLEVEAFLSWGDRRPVEKAAQACAGELARRLLVPDERVAARPHPGTPDLEQRVDLNILNR